MLHITHIARMVVFVLGLLHAPLEYRGHFGGRQLECEVHFEFYLPPTRDW